MFNHELYAASLARAVDVMRLADAKEQQKGALRAVVALAASSSATVRCYDGTLSVDDVGIPDSVQHVGTLTGRMAAHGIAEIAIGRGAEPGEMLALLRGLAEPAGSQSVKDKLRQARSSRIWVLLADPEGVGQVGRTSVSALFEEPVAAPATPGARKKAHKKEDEEALAAWNDLHEEGGSQSTIQEVDLGISTETPTETPVQAAPRPAQPEAPPPELPIAVNTPLGAALLAVARRPNDGNVLDRLTSFAEHALQALREHQGGEVLLALAMIARLEAVAPEGTPKNSYRITLRRILQRETLEQLARHTAEPNLLEAVGAVFARAGGDGTEVLLGLLAAAESTKERRALMGALKTIQHGRDQVVRMLGHHQWFVARNIAELAGEMKLEEGIAELGKLLGHSDVRVRKAAAMALAKIGTPGTADPLLRAMKDGIPETRALIVSQIVSAQGPQFTTALAAQLESEEDPEVLREICLALGRIGSPDAVQTLQRAQKQGGLFSKRARVMKDAVEQALKRTSKG